MDAVVMTEHVVAELTDHRVVVQLERRAVLDRLALGERSGREHAAPVRALLDLQPGRHPAADLSGRILTVGSVRFAPVTAGPPAATVRVPTSGGSVDVSVTGVGGAAPDTRGPQGE